MSKKVTSFTAQLVTYESSRPIDEVIAELNKEIKSEASPKMLETFRNASTKEEIVETFNKGLDGADFLHFGTLSHGKWLNIFYEVQDTPPSYLYTYGNPLIAQKIMKAELTSGLNIPPRLLVTTGEGGKGTKVLYHLPSSVMAVDASNAALKIMCEGLDAKVEKLVAKVLGV